MVARESLFRELVKNGYAQDNSKKVWNIANMSLLYLSNDMAKAFLRLKEHPRYKATIIDIEINLLKKYAKELFKDFNYKDFNLINMGCNDGTKAKVLLKELDKDLKIRYCAVCVNSYVNRLAIENVKKGRFVNVADYVQRIIPDFDEMYDVGIALRNSRYSRNVCLLLGSLLGGFEINDYLFKLSNSMLPGDMLIIGNGIRTGERLVNLETYKHPIFNQWFIHLIKEIGLDESEVDYDAHFANNRVEGFYRIKVDKVIEFGKKKFNFSKGDEILVAVLYKYYEKELENFCKMYFSNVKLFKDPEEEYALVACRK